MIEYQIKDERIVNIYTTSNKLSDEFFTYVYEKCENVRIKVVIHETPSVLEMGFTMDPLTKANIQARLNKECDYFNPPSEYDLKIRGTKIGDIE